MRDEDKTKEQLIEELTELRRRVADFEASEMDFMRGVRIGEILVEARCITISQLHRALQRQKEEDMLKDKRLGEILLESGLITKEERDIALAEQQRRVGRRA